MHKCMLMVMLITLFVEIIHTNTMQVASTDHFESYNRFLGKGFSFLTQEPLKQQTIIYHVCNCKDG